MIRVLPCTAALAHLGVTGWLVVVARDLAAQFGHGDAGAGLLLVISCGVVLAGLRTSAAVLLALAAHLLARFHRPAAGVVATAALACSPRMLREALLGSLTGLTLAGTALLSPAGAALPDPPRQAAHSSPGWPIEEESPASDTSAVPSPGWPIEDEAPEGPEAPDAPEAPDEDESADEVPVTVIVRCGDSLWAIAAAHHPDAPASRLAATVTDIHRANRDVIGADPNLILPGFRLEIP